MMLLNSFETGDFVRGLIGTGAVTACHDLSDGGLAVALAEMALAGGLGATVAPQPGLPPRAWAFGEDQARYLVTTSDPGALLAAAGAAGVPAAQIGRTTDEPVLTLGAGDSISVDTLRAAHESWLPAYMGGA